MKKKSGSFELVLNGGLGNQLFGYSAGKSVEAATGLQCRFIGPSKNDRKFELDNFGIECFSETASNMNPFSRNLPNRIFNKLFPSIFRFSETSFRFDPRFYINPEGQTLRGYFQSYLYLKNVEAELLTLPSRHLPFSTEFKSLDSQWGNQRFVAVHVRRGDYLGKESYHGIASSGYLEIARQKILELKPDAQFVVFSDSIEIAKRDFPSAAKYISEKDLAKPSENLILMSRMGGLIASNSSFSWWAGFLSQHPEMNFFPEPWFSNPRLDTKDLLPANWNTIPSGIQSF